MLELATVLRWLNQDRKSPFHEDKEPPKQVVGVGLGIHSFLNGQNIGKSGESERLLVLAALKAKAVTVLIYSKNP